MLADRKWSIGTGSGIRRLIGLVVTLLLAVAGLSQPALASADTPTVGSCTFDSLGEDAFTYDDPGPAAAITTDTSLVCTEQHEFAQAPNPARHAYDSVRCCVAPSRIPGVADDVADQIDGVVARVDDGLPPPTGVKGGRSWRNDGTDGGQRLPELTTDGSRVTYREWDLNPKGPDGRDGLRVVTGSDGSAWFTDDHYLTFTQIRGGS